MDGNKKVVDEEWTGFWSMCKNRATKINSDLGFANNSLDLDFNL